MRSIVCVFAHPDDEAFGPGGTIAKLARRHRVYILSATKGEAGKDSGKQSRRTLARRRAEELRAAAKILGVRNVYFLGFRDGTLSNNLYHALAARIEAHLKRLRPETLITFEPLGVSGHIDHIAVSMVTSYVFERLKFVTTLLQVCRTKARARSMRGYFIYVPPGYARSEIDLIVNIRDVWDTKLTAMLAHRSQIHDIERILRLSRRFPKEEYFLVRSKHPVNLRALKAALLGPGLA